MSSTCSGVAVPPRARENGFRSSCPTNGRRVASPTCSPFCEKKSDRAHQAYYGRARERSGEHGSRRERLDARDRGRDPEFGRRAAGDRIIGEARQQVRAEAGPGVRNVLDGARATSAMPVRLPPSTLYLTTGALDSARLRCLGPFVSDPFATARIFVIARPNFRRLCAGDYGTLCDIHHGLE